MRTARRPSRHVRGRIQMAIAAPTTGSTQAQSNTSSRIAANDDADGPDGVGEHFEVRALDVDRLLRTLAEQRERDEIGEQPEHGDHQHLDAEHLGFAAETANGLDEHPDRDAEQEECVDECGQDLEPVEPERVRRSPVAAPLLEARGELDRGERHAEPDDVGEHVARVGQQRERVGDHGGDGLRRRRTSR